MGYALCFMGLKFVMEIDQKGGGKAKREGERLKLKRFMGKGILKNFNLHPPKKVNPL